MRWIKIASIHFVCLTLCWASSRTEESYWGKNTQITFSEWLESQLLLALWDGVQFQALETDDNCCLENEGFLSTGPVWPEANLTMWTPSSLKSRKIKKERKKGGIWGHLDVDETLSEHQCPATLLVLFKSLDMVNWPFLLSSSPSWNATEQTVKEFKGY